MNIALRDSLIVFRKEIVDSIRDRKTLMMIFLTAVLIGPVMLVAMSFVVNQQEEKSERREVWVAGLEHSPELHNYLLRQGMKVNPAPVDFESQVRDSRLGEAVIWVPDDFQERQAKGQSPELRVVFDSANRQSTVLVGRNVALLEGFVHEQGLLELSTRGVAPAVLQPFRVQERNLASAQSRSV
jgi:sodium transport system permease protein